MKEKENPRWAPREKEEEKGNPHPPLKARAKAKVKARRKEIRESSHIKENRGRKA
jgi:hypothetical protein